MNKLRVVNIYNQPPTNNDFYIGRGSPLGNPFTSKALVNTKAKYQASSRDESIRLFGEYLLDEVDKGNESIIDELNGIKKRLETSNVNLCCFCKPKDCHGDYIKTFIDDNRIKLLMGKIIKNFKE